VPVIDNPSSALLWQVGEVVNFSGHANDPEEGPLSASSLTWQLDLLHGDDDGSSHVHIIQTFPGVSSGSFSTPDHEYPSWLELSLTAIDQHGASASTMVRLDPETVDLTFHTAPSGLEVAFGGEIITTPFTETVIVNTVVTVSAPTPQQAPDLSWWDFASWSDGGALSHEITAPSSNAIYIAAFDGETFNGTFRDDDNSIFESAIEWLAATGITKGCNPPVNDRFCPDDTVTRGQMAAFFSRAFGYSDDGGGNLFTDDNGHLFEHEIDLLGTAGVTKGCNPPVNNKFCPDNLVTRGQMAAFFQRAFNG
jgi:hypothetical protein